MIKKQKGVSLIEFLIVVAILNIVMFVAIPSYNQYIEETHVGSVKSQMLNLSTDLERVRGRFFSYKSAFDEKGKYIVSPELLRYPTSKNEDLLYNLKIVDVTESEYTILAEPSSNMSENHGALKLVQTGIVVEGYYDEKRDNSWIDKWY